MLNRNAQRFAPTNDLQRMMATLTQKQFCGQTKQNFYCQKHSCWSISCTVEHEVLVKNLQSVFASFAKLAMRRVESEAQSFYENIVYQTS